MLQACRVVGGLAVERVFLATCPAGVVVIDAERLRDRLAAGEHVGGTYLARRKGGSTLPVAYGWRGLHDDNGQVTHYLWVSIDACRQYAAAEATNRLASIIAPTPDLVSTVDPDLRLVSMNPAGRRLLNMSEHDDITRLHDLAADDFGGPRLTAARRGADECCRAAGCNRAAGGGSGGGPRPGAVGAQRPRS